MLRLFALFTLCASLLGALPWLLPVAKTGVRLLEARDNPAALSDLALAHFDAQAASVAMEQALAADDPPLAASYLALADDRGLKVDAALRIRVEEANSTVATALRTARDFSMGFATGEPEELAGLAGALAGDLMVWGDIRDAGREGWRLYQGEDADELILGLSVVGLAVTGGTYVTIGSTLPARAGLSLVKVAKRTGNLSAALGRSLTRAVKESVDLPAAGRLVRGSSALDGAALKGVVRTEKLSGLGRMLGDVGTVQAKAGTRAAMEGMRVAESGADLNRMARLAEVKGPQTLAILKTLGRGALVISGALLKLVWLLFMVVLYAYVLVSSLNAFCVSCARRLWRKKKPSPRGRYALPASRAVPHGGWDGTRGVGRQGRCG